MTTSTFPPAVLHQAGRVVSGAACLLQLPELIAPWKPQRILLVLGRHVTRDPALDQLRSALHAAGVAVVQADPVPPEPEVTDVDAVLAAARLGGPVDLVVGLGGGSAIDVAKAVAVLLVHPVSVHELLSGTPVPGRGLPTVMVPTTAGTGAEATPNSIILVPQDALKVGIVSPYLLPDLVLLDPLLTTSLPPVVTAHTGIDALCHAIECYTSKKHNVFSDLYGLEAIRRISRSVRRAHADGQDTEARLDMLLGSYYGGVCIATSSTTAVHALSYPLGGRYRVPHGLANAMLLPAVMAFNCVGNESRFAAMAQAMDLPVSGLDHMQAAQALVQALVQLNADLGITTRLRDVGVTEADLDALATSASKVTRLLNNNPRPMGHDDMCAIYASVL